MLALALYDAAVNLARELRSVPTIFVVRTEGQQMSDLFVDCWGTGTPVVLVHGSLATGTDEWDAQRSIADEGFRLLVLDRRGYGRSPEVEGEDFLRDAEDIAQVMGDGAHLVGHSYGGLGVLFAAARRPEATLSLTMLEPSGADQPMGDVRCNMAAVHGMSIAAEASRLHAADARESASYVASNVPARR